MPKDRIKVLCQINPQTILRMLILFESESKSQQLSEEGIIVTFQQMSLEVKTTKLNKLLKFEKSLDGLSLAYPSHIFTPRVQYMITMVSQVLSLDNDQSVGEVALGFLLSIYHSKNSLVIKFKFVEFLAEEIHV